MGSEPVQQPTDQFIKVLNHGFVRLVDYMGDDHAIAQAARVSYQKHDEEKAKNDRSLIRYLMKHRHTSPFEMVEVKLHCKMPIFVARQWVRHRTASLNEMSGRYSQLPAEYYLPDASQVKAQSKSNKQGREDELPEGVVEEFLGHTYDMSQEAFEQYDTDISRGIAKELSRINLPLATYTEWYWKMDLHNLFHFLKLRLDSHAQYEIRVYAEAIYEIIKPIVPIACEAFADYSLNAVTFSAQEMEYLLNILDSEVGNWADREFELNEALQDPKHLSQRELDEFKKKLRL